MFSKELENLIQATLEDGVLEENEKAALVKRAQREGVDLDELEIYINSLLQRRQRELNEKNDQHEEEYEKKKKKAIGPVCPKCGKQVPPLTLKCDCGYEFRNDKHESSVKLLSEKIEKIQSRVLKGNPDSFEWKADRKLRDQEVSDAISLFPVPNTKEDIMEFLSLAAPNSRMKGGLWGTILGRIKLLSILAVIVFILCLIFTPTPQNEHDISGAGLGGLLAVCIAFYGGMACFMLDTEVIGYNKKANAWRSKFDQVLMKGRSLKGDPEFTQMLDYYENQMAQYDDESKRIFGIKLFG